MRTDYEEGPYISPEQEKQGNLLGELSSKFREMIEKKRIIAWKKLVDETSDPDTKREELRTYFSFRMEPKTYIVQASDGKKYTFPQMSEIAKALSKDNTFFYNDDPLVLNNLDLFFESITLEDVILAYHNYRLSADDESLSHFAKLVGLYTQKAVEMDGLQVNFPVSDGLLSHEESISHLESIISFVDDYLKRYYEKRKLYLEKYELKKEARIDFTSRIDRNAIQSFSKKSPLEIRISKLTEFMLNVGSFDCVYDFDILLEELYKKHNILHSIEFEDLSSIQWPTFDDLLDLAQNRCKKEDKRNLYDPDFYKSFIAGLNTIRDRNMIADFNVQIRITREDFDEAEKNNNEVDNEAAFDNIQTHIRLFFIICFATERILEFSSDEAKTRERQKNCRKMCEIFSNDEAYEYITHEDGIDQERIIEKESMANQKKLEMFRECLLLFDLSSAELIMKNRLSLLDKAKKYISSEDIAFLEKCSEHLLTLLKEKTEKERLSPFIEKLKSELNTGKQIQMPGTVIHTLSTAELLFDRYATEEFEAQGFDYSSISALYYQAFENAYNELIWGKYANYLNNLKIDDQKFTAILANQHDKGIFQPSDLGYGYLPPKEGGRQKDKAFWKYYSHNDYSKKITYVNKTCMYSSFIMFIASNMENELHGFYEWFAQELGFSGRITMQSNSTFMRLLNQFRNDISTAAEKRNKASHGGNKITKKQCTTDRETVLSDLHTTRSTYLGLIRQLMALLNFCFTTDK